MLSEIYIRNLAVIEEVRIVFGMGLNIFTGETGAGKSIVVDSINAVLGQRVSRDLIRTGTDTATIIGVFRDIPEEIEKKIREYGYETDDGQMIVQREIHSDGKNVARLCGRPVNLNVLKELCGDLVNIHGQHDSQILLDPDRHLSILDSFGDYGEEFSAYETLFAELRAVALEVKKLTADQSEKERRLDLLRFQIGEIRSASLAPNEEESVESELKAMRNYADLAENLRAAYAYLHGGDEEDGAVGLLAQAAREVTDASRILSDMEPVGASLEDLHYTAEDLGGKIGRFLESFDFDPNRLAYLEERQDEIRRLKRKYGSSVEEILSFADKAEKELNDLENAETLLEEYSGKQHELLVQARALAQKLSDRRHKTAERFKKDVEKELRFLDMPNVVLDVRFTPCRLNRFGLENVEFLISTNPGEPPKPMHRIASGGELSRIMLAIKSVLADRDRIPTMIFDEIDTGVSGSAAQKIGLKLKEVSRRKQVICVTHLAQIAALADRHLLIVKDTEGERTYTRVEILDDGGRIREVARIMGTGKMTDLLLKNAEELIRNGRELTDLR